MSDAWSYVDGQSIEDFFRNYDEFFARYVKPLPYSEDADELPQMPRARDLTRRYGSSLMIEAICEVLEEMGDLAGLLNIVEPTLEMKHGLAPQTPAEPVFAREFQGLEPRYSARDEEERAIYNKTTLSDLVRPRDWRTENEAPRSPRRSKRR